MPDKLDLESLNPGVRRLVALLRANGFNTTDSGDGVTNVEAGMEGALEVPHVFMSVDPDADGIFEADTLFELLADVGIELRPGMIQFSFDPLDRSRVLALFGVSDRDLPPPGWEEP